MRRRIAVLGATDDAIEALPLLASRSDLELACVYDADALALRRRLAVYEPAAAALLQKLLTDDPSALAGLEAIPASEVPALVGLPAAAASDAERELLDALGEIADAAALVDDPPAAHQRLLGAALAATRASGGSLLLTDARRETLRMVAATDVERELWPKIALRLGQGLAGRAWAEGRTLLVRGTADPSTFDLVRTRRDRASAAVIPLVHAGTTYGVLCLHHATCGEPLGEAGAFDALGAALARVLDAVERRRTTRERARASEVEAAVRNLFARAAPREQRLAALCRLAAAASGGGVATLWAQDEGDAREAPLRLVASSLPGGALGAAATLAPGEGVDGRAARERAPVLLRRECGALAYAALPLLDGARLLGVLAVQTGPASDADVEVVLDALAAAAAREIAQDAQLADARRRGALGALIADAAQHLVTAREPDRVAAALATHAALAAEAEHAVVRVFDPKRRSFRVRARVGAEQLGPDSIQALDRRAASEAVRQRIALDAPADDEPAWLVVPIQTSGRIVGTLGLYGKRPPAAGFDPLDREAAERLAALAAAGLAAARAPSACEEAAVGIVGDAAFARRLEAEIARAHAAGANGAAFVLVACRIESAATPAGDAADRVARALAAELRPFDSATRAGDDTLLALLPEPGGAPAERVARLARAVTERAFGDAAGERPALVFGWALHPDDGATAGRLRAAAAQARLRML